MTPGERRHRKRLRRFAEAARTSPSELRALRARYLREWTRELRRTGSLSDHVIDQARALGIEHELRLQGVELVARRGEGPRFVSHSVSRPSTHRREEHDAVYGE